MPEREKEGGRRNSPAWREERGGGAGAVAATAFGLRFGAESGADGSVPAVSLRLAGGASHGAPPLASPTRSHSPRPPKFPPRLKLSFPPNPPPRPPPKFPEPLRPKRGGGGGQPLGTAQAAGSRGSWGRAGGWGGEARAHLSGWLRRWPSPAWRGLSAPRSCGRSQCGISGLKRGEIGMEM